MTTDAAGMAACDAGAPTATLFARESPTRLHEEGAPAEGVLVSVVVTLFNYGHYLEECLRSVVAQTHRRLELIIVDDHSTDDSAAVAKAWLATHHARFERVALLRHTANQGLSIARNTAFAAAQGEYVFVLDADNAIYPRAIARLLDAIRSGDYGVAYSQLELFEDESRLGDADVWDPDRFQRHNYVDAMALITKAAWARVGGYTIMKFGWEDYDLWCKFVELGISGLFVPEILCRYRVHGKSMLRVQTNPRAGAVIKDMMTRHPWLRLGE